MPWLWVVVLLGLLAMVGTMMILVLSRWVRRAAAERELGVGPAAPEREEPEDAWSEAARRVDVEIDPEGPDDEEEDDRPEA